MNVLFISDHPDLNTGQAKTGKEIVPFLPVRYYLGWVEPPHAVGCLIKTGHPNGYAEIFTIRKSDVESQIATVETLLKRGLIDRIIGHCDVWSFHWLLDLKSKYRFGLILWLACEGSGNPRISRLLMRTADSVAAVSEFSRDCLRADGIRDVAVAPNGLSKLWLDPLSSDRPIESVPIAQALMRSRPIYLFVGRNIRRKSLDVLIRAWLKAKRDSAYMKAAGLFLVTSSIDKYGINIPEYMQEIGAVGDVGISLIESGVGAGIDEKKLLWLNRKADFIVSAATAESFAMPIVEGMSQECILVANEGSAIEAHYKASESNGYIAGGSVEFASERGSFVRIASVDGMAEALIQSAHDFQENPDLIETMQKNSRRYARRFTWEKTANALEELLKKSPHDFRLFNENLVI